MRTLEIKLPDTLELDEQETLLLLATRLYEKGKLSLGQAADMVGMTKWAFSEILGFYGVSIFNYPVSDLARDVKNA